MKKFSRLMEALTERTPTRQGSLVTKEADKFSNEPLLYSIMAMEYPSNNIGLHRAKKWLAKAFNIFDEEVESMYNALRDLGDVAYYLDPSKRTDKVYSLENLHSLLTLDCSTISGDSFNLFKEAIEDMSALERKWFVRFWLKTPRNGINRGVVKKFLAKRFKLKIADVKKHCNYNSVFQVCNYYQMGETPSIEMVHGKSVEPRLAKSIKPKAFPNDKIVDYKYDGNRYQIHKKGGKVIIFNRKCKVVSYQFPEIILRICEYENDGIFDGEIYPIKADGSPAPHQTLGTRIHSKNIEAAIEKCPVEWVMFDVLMLDGETLVDMPYRERLAKMEHLPDQAHRSEGDVIAFYNQAISDGFEGVIVKDANAPYESGRRSKFWAKYKPPRIELDVAILGAKYGDGARGNVFASYDVGVKSEAGFTSIGSVGTGFSENDLLRLTNQLRPLVDSFTNGKYFFLPRVVLEVSADLISKDTKGNYGLRFPRVIRIRDDKHVADINSLEDVKEMVGV